VGGIYSFIKSPLWLTPWLLLSGLLTRRAKTYASAGAAVACALLCRACLGTGGRLLWLALALLLCGCMWCASLPPHDTTLALCAGIAVLVCFAGSSWRQMSAPLTVPCL
jgi:hypothetical protein